MSAAHPFTPIQPARLDFAPDGTPRSTDYGDVYHTAAGGLEQARQVFMAGCGLPERWQGRERFTILETGFGLGLNFLATWAAWRADLARSRELHFVSTEKHPFSAADLAVLHRAWPELEPLADELRRAWPDLLPGTHRLHLGSGADGDRVTLTLLFGDALATLPQLQARVDAIYLDGFSPAKNPELWSPQVFYPLARLAAPGARIATWSVAGAVREGLARAGFCVDKVPGFGTKRERLVGERTARDNDPAPAETSGAGPDDRRALVIGAGFAGTSVAERLAARGWQVEVIDAVGPGAGASGNRIGVLRPLPAVDDNRLARLTRAAFLYTRHHLQALSAQGLPVQWGASGVLHLGRDPVHEATQRKVVELHQPPADYLRYVGQDEAAAIAGWPTAAGGWFFPGGGWGVPPSLCRANLARFPERIRTRFGQAVASIAHRDGEWEAHAEDGTLLGRAPHLVLANAAAAKALYPAPWLPLRPARGQTTVIPAAALPAPKVVVCRLGYVTPVVDGYRVCGASFIAGDTDPALRPAEHRENLQKLDFILPGLTAQAEPPLDPDTLEGRVGFRPVSPDRLPMVGALPAAEAAPGQSLAAIPRLPGLWLLNGFGARGLVWSAHAGELLASRMAGDPLPLEADLADALDPARFLLPGRRWRNERDQGGE
ncbi:bifunctional tRNA (5-methylaminomethyl-2-thiouridine)(34)-methyltransferase MnmD/FAD-dependent 5-carboxymethylaminomethyl-2-thiouridine(34) oxidoreductase MnmC [Oryzomicrobium sp.]|uniref:bifunctional tRNA (5-methylaminomethyl-2-thiouridine)(34)-methyltransferase MnmD/FAD-dependent 5-carboxymethylaminomethyl-2-thiouridine(34) oxidoreductase MnmC n=1 Tax=Oryzomicrobium sp. TaxID=1911578 RepID=UPI0025E2A28D|nr:bifunctional tRNA (5-methylaminomethyl-2-thiouridine)(34)-methyltransferase MnmD/FAD-dependent 5-carboxymethylaminomethyl-2-thiouridine(34) oxidoreductase MnmC [Oryzomicrobium sp.]MCE1242743.1 bifunctional tRNA (5-methylaminomethyl-2-thiouridine)(34)-methyltransferase MnmD/FAD-dependent 5-carboxymethylaminomethyl-2-thiouridine(34) oxidoreductase MnmC [Oryzomicrobium sp.]